jgi:tetratricopeptide (TPR) repeat protein
MVIRFLLKNTRNVIIFFSFFIIVNSCGDKKDEQKLVNIENTVDSDPLVAVNMLRDIDCDKLSESGRHYYDLLSVKANDKADIIHTSDSLILDVIDYYASHKSGDKYAEALYYGGRVYSDLKDYPTALRYYQDALNEVSKEQNDLRLRGNVLSQTASIYNKLRLFDKATSCLAQVIEIDTRCSDSINLMYDLQLLGTISLHTQDYNKADSAFINARCLASKLKPSCVSQQDMYLAATSLGRGDINAALRRIRGVPDKISPAYRNTALSYASKIYMKSGILDTAYSYANRLVESSDDLNKGNGYQILLSSELAQYVSSDSVHSYITNYRLILEHRLNENESQAALLQESFFNYKIHDQERQKAEQSKIKIERWSALILILSLILFVIILYLKNKNKSNLVKLHEAIDNIKQLRKEIERTKVVESDSKSIYRKHELTGQKSSDLRECLREELLSLQQSGVKPIAIAPEIINSEPYKSVMSYIERDKVIAVASSHRR